MAFGEYVVMLRKQLKVSRYDLAKRFGTSVPFIGRYKRSDIKPSIKKSKKITDEPSVTVNYLISGPVKMVLCKKLIKRMEDTETLQLLISTKYII